MPQWIITLKGEKRDLEDLPSQFGTPACSVLDAQGRYHLTSTKLNEITEPHDVLAEAQNMLAIMTSSVQLFLITAHRAAAR